MEHGLGPAFDRTGQGTFEGYAGGSGALVNQIKGHLRHADIFISANPKLNEKLTGPANGDWVRWSIVFAQSPLVIGYNPASRFAADLRTRPWYEVLQEPGIRIGRTDPVLDPKGALTVQLLQHAEQVYKIPGLADRVLTADQVCPEPNLVGRLQSGEIDAGFFYSTETTDLHIPAIPLPPEVAQTAHYSITILHDAPNPPSAAAFTAFLIGPSGDDLMRQHGLTALRPTATGDLAAIPAAVRAELARPK
jgi:molybdate/tungstate transport system substrate-binding protein